MSRAQEVYTTYTPEQSTHETTNIRIDNPVFDDIIAKTIIAKTTSLARDHTFTPHHVPTDPLKALIYALNHHIDHLTYPQEIEPTLHKAIETAARETDPEPTDTFDSVATAFYTHLFETLRNQPTLTQQ